MSFIERKEEEEDAGQETWKHVGLALGPWFGHSSRGFQSNGWKMRGSEQAPAGQALAVQGLYGITLPGL